MATLTQKKMALIMNNYKKLNTFFHHSKLSLGGKTPQQYLQPKGYHKNYFFDNSKKATVMLYTFIFIEFLKNL